jgi:putative transposase
MPRRPRIIVPEIPLHIIQRGNNRQACFFTDDDYIFYLDWLKEYAQGSACLLHAFVLMTNHVHLLLTPKYTHSAGELMKRLGQRYVQYVNKTYQRSGTLWEGRFRSCIVQQEEYLFSCQRYIEMNPVRAEMVIHPGEYRWSSYRSNGLGENLELITPHTLYLDLGKNRQEREEAYRELFRYDLEPGEIDKIRKATNGNFALGNERFSEEISKNLGRRVSPGKAGRPKKV